MKMKNEMKNKNEMKIQKWNKEQQHHKNLTEGSPKQSNIAVSFCLPIKKNDVINITFISNYFSYGDDFDI